MNKGVPRKSNAQSSESVRDKKEKEGREKWEGEGRRRRRRNRKEDSVIQVTTKEETGALSASAPRYSRSPSVGFCIIFEKIKELFNLVFLNS